MDVSTSTDSSLSSLSSKENIEINAKVLDDIINNSLRSESSSSSVSSTGSRLNTSRLISKRSRKKILDQVSSQQQDESECVSQATKANTQPQNMKTDQHVTLTSNDRQNEQSRNKEPAPNNSGVIMKFRALNGGSVSKPGGDRRKSQPRKKCSCRLQGISKLSEKTGRMIPRLSFQRLVKEIVQDFKLDYRFQTSALEALQESAEQFLVQIIESGNIAAAHNKRVTLKIEDLNFVDLVASCDMTLGGVPVTAYARVNHCHNPVDVTFQVLGKDPRQVSWRYTYVTTNLAENVVLSKHIMLAMMASQKENGRRINIQARFLLDGSGGTELEFLDTDLTLPIPQKNCVAVPSTGGPGWIAGACLLGLAVAALVVTLAVIRARTGVNLPGHRIPARVWRRFGQYRGNSGGTVVQYVVPADTPPDLQVYISTGDGLQPVHHNNNKAEIQLAPANLKQPGSVLPTKLESSPSSGIASKKGETVKCDSPPRSVGGITNTAFEWDEGEGDRDDLVKENLDSDLEHDTEPDKQDPGLSTGARPKTRS